MRSRSLALIILTSMALAGCATFKPPQISYDDERSGLHQPSSFDQLMAWTNTPRGFFLGRSASCGVSKTTVRMAVQRSVAVLVAAFDPGDPEAVIGGPDHARDVDRDLDLPDLAERIADAGIVVERDCALVGDEVVGGKPVLADDDRVRRKRPDVLDEAREMPGDLRIVRPVICDRWRHGLGLAQLVNLDHPGRDGATRGVPDQAAGKSRGEEQVAEGDEPPVAGLDAGPAPMRSSQAWAAFW